MIDNLLGGGDDDEDPDEVGEENADGGVFDEDGDDLMGGDDDLMGGGDDLMGDDMGFDDMDDGGTATSAEMDNRIDELENEVASLSSTVSTVKSENEQISESVTDVEENVRKLLEVYEMVTRGVNPFVDETEMGDAFGGGGGGGGGGSGGSMGLFGGDEEEEPETEVDSAVADADAEEFFDDDLDEDDDLDDFDDEPDEFDEIDDEADDLDDDFDDDLDDDFDDDLDDDFDDDLDDDFDDDLEDEGDSGGGKSFEELKAEYESGDADWDDEADEADEADLDADTTVDAEPEPAVDGLDDEPVESLDEVEQEPMDDTEGVAHESTVTDEQATSRSHRGSRSGIHGGKPYLEALPSGYVADLVVMDWLEFLVDEAGVDGAAATIAYYEAIDWIDETAAESLQTFLNGFGGGFEADPDPESSLTVEHHNTSLRFISRIANPDMEMVAFEKHGRMGGDRRWRGAALAPDRQAVRAQTFSDRREVESDGGRDLDGASESDSDRRSTRARDLSQPGKRSDGFDWADDRTE